MIKIKVSTKWLNKKFGCNKDFIKTFCKGKCCNGSNKLLVSLLPQETKILQTQFSDCKIKNNKIVGKNKECYFKDKYGFCKIHNTKYKPLGCVFSPFKINKNNTLIIRHRYIKFPCFNKEDGKPAYITFNDSLTRVFGEKIYKLIKKKMKENTSDFFVYIDNDVLEKLNFLEKVKYD